MRYFSVPTFVVVLLLLILLVILGVI